MMIKPLFLLTLSLVAITNLVAPITAFQPFNDYSCVVNKYNGCHRVNTSCPKGCYLPEKEQIDDNGFRDCVDVGVGFFSPLDDDKRYNCAPGYYSNSQTASKCTPCPAGSIGTSEGATECFDCLPGLFQSYQGKTECWPCDDSYYNGSGSNTIYYGPEGNDFFCLKYQYSYAPSQEPTALLVPSVAPSMAPSSNPSAYDPEMFHEVSISVAVIVLLPLILGLPATLYALCMILKWKYHKKYRKNNHHKTNTDTSSVGTSEAAGTQKINSRNIDGYDTTNILQDSTRQVQSSSDYLIAEENGNNHIQHDATATTISNWTYENQMASPRQVHSHAL